MHISTDCRQFIHPGSSVGTQRYCYESHLDNVVPVSGTLTNNVIGFYLGNRGTTLLSVRTARPDD